MPMRFATPGVFLPAMSGSAIVSSTASVGSDLNTTSSGMSGCMR